MAINRAVVGQLSLSNPGDRSTCILPSVPNPRNWDRDHTYRYVAYHTPWPPVACDPEPVRLTNADMLGAPGHISWPPLEDLSTRLSTPTFQRNQIETLSPPLAPKVQGCSSAHAPVPPGVCAEAVASAKGSVYLMAIQSLEMPRHPQLLGHRKTRRAPWASGSGAVKRLSSPQSVHNSRVLPCTPGHILRGFILVLGDQVTLA
jgi:hypothetical protein